MAALGHLICHLIFEQVARQGTLLGFIIVGEVGPVTSHVGLVTSFVAWCACVWNEMKKAGAALAKSIAHVGTPWLELF